MPRNRAQFRIRSLHPNLLTSERYSGLSDFADVLFLRLHLCADDEGRSLADPRLLRAWLYPLRDRVTPEQIEAGLDELELAGLVIQYQTDGRPAVSITDFGQFQHPKNPRPSDLPIPPPPSATTPPLRPGSGRGIVSAGQGFAATTTPNGPMEREVEVERESNPLTPAERGKGSLRSRGENPRAQGTNPRAEPRPPNPADLCDLCDANGFVLDTDGMPRFPIARCGHQVLW